MSSQYQSVFAVIPARIMYLPDITLAFLRIYDTIFQFWNHGKPCFLSNESIMERTGISSESTLREAFMYFESKGELIRRKKGKTRYFVQPERVIETEDIGRSKSDHGVDRATVDRRQSDGMTVDAATHKNKNINNKKIEREQTRKKRVPLPDDFTPKAEAGIEAERKGLDLSKLLASFTAHVKSNGWTRIDWHEAFMKWVIDEKINISETKKSELHSNVMEYGPGHPTFDAMEEWKRKQGMTHGSEISRDNAGRANLL